ncbi:hypothetical protein R3P38DRAFT_2800794 [Favolaschia claudopus]|uniref:Uncharacterized protein n=1 Tax=Favolaschia claudopus TaxID=2862362 RepID=A0AAV9ZX04_9AGAR
MAMQRNRGKRPQKRQALPKTGNKNGRKKAPRKSSPIHRSPSPADPSQDGSDFEPNDHEEEEEEELEEEDEPGRQGSEDAAAGNGDSGGEEVTRNALNARARHWQAWQDRVLVQQANADRPVLRAAAWNGTADAINATISKTATHPWSPRSGGACRKRLLRLVTKFKAEETKSLQQTGKSEEISEFLHTLNIRLEQDEAALQDARAQDQARHNEQMNALKKMTESLQGLRDEQEKTNTLLRNQELDRREEQIRLREKELHITE